MFEEMASMQRLMMHSFVETKPRKKAPTHAQMWAMVIIMQAGKNRIHIKDLAGHLRMTSSAVTQLVDGLVKEKLLLRTADLADRRKIGVSLTAQGRKELEEAKRQKFITISKLFESLSDNEIEQLYTIQQKIIDHAKKLWPQKTKKIT